MRNTRAGKAAIVGGFLLGVSVLVLMCDWIIEGIIENRPGPAHPVVMALVIFGGMMLGGVLLIVSLFVEVS